MENGIDLPTRSQRIEQPTFTDGEQDLWPSCQVNLQRFDSLPAAEYARQVAIIERERETNLLNYLQAMLHKLDVVL